MKKQHPLDQPHRRYDLLNDQWVLVSPQRLKRPWQGRSEPVSYEKPVQHDSSCYLCPGNARAGGKRNPRYRNTFAFENDFAALRPDVPTQLIQGPPLLQAESERGICRVLCFSPRHDLSLAQMPEKDISIVVAAWIREYRDLAARHYLSNVLIFENRGELMGCSNAHPHCQIWGQESVPHAIVRELRSQRIYRDRTAQCLLCHYLRTELKVRDRIVESNQDFVALVPFWAIWPFEIMLLSRNHHGALPDLSQREKKNLATILYRITRRYDNLFRVAFPYSMGWHQIPTDGKDYPEAHLHAHFYPPLLRSASVRKFMVGYELLGEPQRDFTPERGARLLRKQPIRRFV